MTSTTTVFKFVKLCRSINVVEEFRREDIEKAAHKWFIHRFRNKTNKLKNITDLDKRSIISYVG